MGGEGIEELVIHAPMRVAILEDEPGILRPLLLYLNRRGEKDKITFTGSDDPDYIYYIVTQNSSIDVLVSDILLNKTPQEKKTKFGNGVKVTEASKEVRGDSLRTVVMSAREISDQYLIDIVGKSPLIDRKWHKSGHYEELYAIILQCVSELELLLPEYPRLYLITGPSSSGKNSSAGYLDKRTLGVRAIPSATNRERRPSEYPSPKAAPLYQRLEHIFFPSLDDMHELIMRTTKPLIWTRSGEIFDKEQYASLGKKHFKGTDLYVLNLEAVDQALEERNDAIVVTPVIKVVEELSRRYGNKSMRIVYEADDNSRIQWAVAEGRSEPELEIVATEKMQPYLEIPDAIVINTDFGSRFGTGNLGFIKERSIDAVQFRTSTVIQRLRKKPHGTLLPEISADYLSKIEDILAGDARKLEEVQTIEIPEGIVTQFYDVKMEEYKRLTAAGIADTALETFTAIPKIDKIDITNVVTAGSVKRVRMFPSCVRGAQLDAMDRRFYGDVAKELVSFYLSQKGLKSIAPPVIHRETNLAHSEPNLVFALTDRAKEPGVYRLELLFY